MTSRYRDLQWGTKSGDYPIVIEKFNAFKDTEAKVEVTEGNASIGKYRAPFARLAVSRDTLYAVTVRADYYYEIQKQIPVLAADLFYLIDKPSVAGEVAYIQLIVNEDKSMRAKIRTESKLYVYEYRLETEQWHGVYVDCSKPRNW
jgi:hypothetical protein